MNDKTVRILALVCAANARIEGMKAENNQRIAIEASMAYTDQDFAYEAAELERLAFEVIQQ